MHRPIDLRHWPRRHAFEFFQRCRQPLFSLCSRVDVAGALRAAAAMPGAGINLLVHHALLGAVNAQAPMRQRIVGGLPVEFDRIDASTTVLRADESLAFAELPHVEPLAEFVRVARTAMDAARGSPAGPLGSAEPRLDRVHTTVLPWLSFSSFSHPRQGEADLSIPKIALGRIEPECADGRVWMPVHAEVHHALMDGLHMARFFESFQQRLDALAAAAELRC